MARILTYKVVSSSAAEDRQGSDRIQETHIIATDSTVTKAWIRNHPLTPKLNTQVRDAPGYFWDNVAPDQTHRLLWKIDCSATPFQFAPLPNSPLAEPADISLDSELVEEPTLFDFKGRPIMNRAGEWIAGVTTERPLLTYNITKNLGADPVWLETHLGAVNKDSVRIRGRVRPANTLMLRRASLSSYTTRDRIQFTTASISLAYDPRQWIKRFWNRGTIQIIEFRTDAGRKAWKQSRIKMPGTQTPVEEPVFLDLKGAVIPGMLTPEEDTPVDMSKVVILEFHVQPLQTFSGVLPLT